MKKIIGFALAAVMAVTLSACGGDHSDSPGGVAPKPSDSVPPQAARPVQSPNTEEPSGGATETTAPGEKPTVNGEVTTLVIYFSATGNTKAVAETIAEAAGGDLYEIIPEEPYTADDLNWREEGSRVSLEHNDPDSRPAIAGEGPDLSGYDTVFVGYPSWWGEAPNIVRTLVESLDFSGKSVIPFCTSASSDLGSSGETLAALTTGATWLEGRRFAGGTDKTEVTDWVNGLDYTKRKTS